MRSLSAPASGEALPMEQEFKQGYRMHRVLSNLNRLDVDRLDDADRERVETASKPYTEAAFFHFKATGSPNVTAPTTPPTSRMRSQLCSRQTTQPDTRRSPSRT